MTPPLPDPATAPRDFLCALAGLAATALADLAPPAEAAGCSVHVLDGEGPAALHAAGARALAASLARGGRPMLLLSAGGATPGAQTNADYARALATGLMGYERIHALACDLAADGRPVAALVGPETLSRAGQTGAAAQEAQDFFAALGDLVPLGSAGPHLPGPHLPGLRALLILPPVAPNAYWQR